MLPGSPGDGDTVRCVDAEGEDVGDQASLLAGRGWACALRRRVEVCVERAAVQIHQIQDGRRQLLHHRVLEYIKNINIKH